MIRLLATQDLLYDYGEAGEPPVKTETGKTGDCVAGRELAYVYAVLDVDRRPRYVGHSGDPEHRVRVHWVQRRNAYRNRENPGFYGWLQSLPCHPGYCILAVVP